ncbi:hypothetical protein G4Y79_12680 [Phototrophicus methaneseepsis]|uniref:Uncharacterized protein n=1 Tax=Phototrophicus methaneseepsis TaxID=2710758 RepID=A0A7S8E556_9CHLR|nr:hypothetical protein [Phototrophicus methaneseepsis]QPC80568.1 hypothetical protein G4Y79_12680 [Phototrophicus methaneseepsis]
MSDQFDDLRAKYKDVPVDTFVKQWQYDAVSSAGIVQSSLTMITNLIESNDVDLEELQVILEIALQSNENTIRKIRFAAKYIEDQTLTKD